MNSVENYPTVQMKPASGNAASPRFYNTNGFTYNKLPLKRPRELPLSFIGQDISSQLLQQTQTVDQLILNHEENVRAELREHQRRSWMQILAVVEEDVSNQLRSKDEEIERTRNLNWALEERIRVLSVEIGYWRELAQKNESAMVVLRSNLEQVLAEQVSTNDAESSCRGGNLEKETRCSPNSSARGVCRNCWEGEASVLLLPCRHLCLCGACGPLVNECPVCKCKNEFGLIVSIV